MIYYLLQFDKGESHLVRLPGENQIATEALLDLYQTRSLPPAEFVFLLCQEYGFSRIPNVQTGLIIHSINFKPSRTKCKVYNCSNHTDEGHFVGEFCGPCYFFITESDQINNQVVRNALNLCQKKLGLQ